MGGWMFNTRPRRTDARGGFTLLEVLIAFVIMTIVLTALFRGFASGLRGLDISEGYATAALQARSKLDELGILIPLEPGGAEGEFSDGARWNLSIEAFDPPGDSIATDLPVMAYRVELLVSWGEDRSLRLETLRLGEPL